MRLPEERLPSRTAIATETRLARTGNGLDHSRPRIDAADRMAHHVDDEQVAGRIEAHFVGLPHRRLAGRPAIATHARFTISREHREPARDGIDVTDAVIAKVAEDQSAIGGENHAKRFGDRSVRSHRALFGSSCDPVAD